MKMEVYANNRHHQIAKNKKPLQRVVFFRLWMRIPKMAGVPCRMIPTRAT